MANTLRSLLHERAIRDIVPERKDGTVVLRLSDTLEHAVTSLGERRILSAPLLRSEPENNECLGFIEMIDVMHFVVDIAPDILDLLPGTSASELKTTTIADIIRRLSPSFSASSLGHSHKHRESEEDADALSEKEESEREHDRQKEKEMMAKDPFVVTKMEQKADHLLQVFARGIRRVAICDESKVVTSTCSQSDMLRWLLQRLDSISDSSSEQDLRARELAKKSMTELGFKSGPVASTSHRSNVLLALKTMMRLHTDALAIVDDTGCLYANFSASDLRGLYQEHLPHFLHSVSDFLKQHSPHSMQVVTGTPGSPLIDVMRLFVEKKLHRLWVVDQNRKPIGIITITDILRIFANH